MCKKLFAFLFLMLMSQAIFADATSSTSAADFSIGYLTMLFGAVGNVFPGAGIQIMGTIFEKFNEGVIVVAVIVLAYNALYTAVKIAMDGQVINPQSNLVFVCLRVGLGFTVLLPHASGYNLLQQGLMQLVVKSVDLANSTWGAALGYLSQGQLFTPPGSGAAPSPLINKMFNSEYQNAMMNTGRQNAPTIGDNTDNDLSKSFEAKIILAEACSMYHYVTNTGNTFSTAPQMGVSGRAVGFPSSSSNQTGCGSINYISDPGHFPTAVQNRTYISIADSLQSAARALFCQADSKDINSMTASDPKLSKQRYDMLCAGRKDTGSVNPPLSISMAGASISSAFVSFSRQLVPVIQAQAADGDTSRQFFASARKQGWVMAGSYYWNLTSLKAQQEVQGSFKSYIGGMSVVIPGFFKGSNMSVFKTYMNRSFSQARDYVRDIKPSTGSTTRDELDLPSGSQGGGNNVIGGVSTSVVSMVPIIGQIAALVGGYVMMAQILDPTSSFSSSDPMITLNRLGNKCIDTAANLYFGALISALILLVVTAPCQGQLNLSMAISTAVSWLVPIFATIAGALIGAGFFMAYYVPLFPYIVFTFGVLAWLVAVIEAMVAMPLVALGVTHPEGHDLLGRAEQAMMLALGVFLRPVLMIIGLFAGMLLSLIAYRILIFSFGNLLHSLSSSSGTFKAKEFMGSFDSFLNAQQAVSPSPFGAIARAMIGFPIMMIIFTYLIYVVTEQCYSLIATLPDYILRWIGGPQSASAINPMQMAGQVGSMAQSTASQVGGAMSKSMESGGGHVAKILAEKDYSDDQETGDGQAEAGDEKGESKDNNSSGGNSASMKTEGKGEGKGEGEGGGGGKGEGGGGGKGGGKGGRKNKLKANTASGDEYKADGNEDDFDDLA